MATEDRFMTAFSSLVRRALDNDGTIDRRALYPAKVVKWETSGIFPSGTVDVVFNNDDAGESATKLQTISAVPVLPAAWLSPHADSTIPAPPAPSAAMPARRRNAARVRPAWWS